MPPRDIPERQRRPQRDPWPRIIAVHERAHVVAAGIEARDRRAVLAQYARLGVHLHADGRTEIGRVDPHREEWRTNDRRDARVGLVADIAEVPLVDGAATAEFGIAALLRIGVV